jgi:hypothetical protein
LASTCGGCCCIRHRPHEAQSAHTANYRINIKPPRT